MKDAVAHQGRKFLIVHDNAVVGEDMREALMDWGAIEVDVRCSLAETWGQDYAAAFFGLPIANIMHDHKVMRLSQCGTEIIVLNGDLPDSALAESGMHPLSQPFRGEDLIELLGRLGLQAA